MRGIKLDDPLLKFFHSLLDDNEEKKILSMIFKNYSEEKILEALINFKQSEKANA